MVRDAVGLVYALGYRAVAMVAGHDAGAPVATWSALIRPDIFRSVTIMSSPFEGPPALPFDTANGGGAPRRAVSDDGLDAELAKLNPPRKYYVPRIGEPSGPVERFLFRIHLNQRVAGDELLGLGERSVDEGSLAAGILDAKASRARMKSQCVQQDARLLQVHVISWVLGAGCRVLGAGCPQAIRRTKGAPNRHAATGGGDALS
jgi:pimeloyl-ACP methyl ester carboxylesterase